MSIRSEGEREQTRGGGGHHWADLREAGTVGGLRFLSVVYRLFGRNIFTVMLYPGAIYFALVRPVFRRASLDYLRTHYAAQPDYWSNRPGFFSAVNHFMSFGHSILDKVLAWTTDLDHDDFRFPDAEAVEQIHKDKRGRLVIGSHYGNLEFCRGYMQRYESLPINILVHDTHASNFAELMSNISPESRLNIYQVEDLDIALILKLRNKVQAGEWLFIAGDRVPVHSSSRTTEVNFMGRRALLPIGPYLLAQSLGCPVTIMFAYRRQGHINLEVVPFADKVEIARKDRAASLNQCAQRFADALAARCLIEPLQWFNFFDFWQGGERRDG